MGGVYTKFLLEDNYKVYGIDPDENNAKMFYFLWRRIAK